MGISIKAIEEAILEERGNISAVARKFDVARSTIASRIAKSDTLKSAVQEARDTMLDEAENILHNKIYDGDTVSLLFYLKTIGQSRGYIEKQQVQSDNVHRVIIEYDDDH